MKIRYEDQVQGRLDFAIVDEVDSILIDEARTPLIISGPAHGDVSRYKWADSLARSLVRQQQSSTTRPPGASSEWGDNPPEDLLKQPQVRGRASSASASIPSMLTEDEAEAIEHQQLYVVQQDRKQVHLTHEGVAARPGRGRHRQLLRRGEHGVAAPDRERPAGPRGLRARQGLRRPGPARSSSSTSSPAG